MMKNLAQLAWLKIRTTIMVLATAIMLRSIAANSSRRSPVMAVKQASEITSSALRENN